MESSPLNDMRTTPPAPEEHSSSSSTLIATTVVIILLIIGAWFVLSGRVKTTVTYDQQGNKITHVEPGSVVKSFPERFLVEAGAMIEESFTIDYRNDGALLATARYVSAQDLGSNINMFGAIFVEEGWLVTVEPDYEAVGATNFYAINGQEQVNITFIPLEEGTEVIISHLLQG